MNLQTKTEMLGDGTVVLAVAGELDLQTAPQFERQLLEATSNGASSAIIDLSECGFLDCSTLNLLVETKERFGARAGKLALVIAADRLLLPFRLTGLDRQFAIHPTRQAALNGEIDKGKSRARNTRRRSAMSSATLIVNDRHVALPSQDTERVLEGLQKVANDPSPLAAQPGL